jgi:FKBP-type peptidyl-prolyl cis-trans isomerase FkpA
VAKYIDGKIDHLSWRPIMSKVLREKRRAAKLAKRRNQRITIGIIIFLTIITIIYLSLPSYSKDGVTPMDVITTTSGLQYQELVLGDGAEAKIGDTVSVHYTGWLEDGTKFDSSLDRNSPFDFTIGAGMVIKGWDEGVAGMKVGGSRKLIIHPNLGYGSSGSGNVIPPNATILFEVQLLDIK